MKKVILTLPIFFALTTIAQARSIHIYDGAFEGQKVIFTTDDYGETRGARAYEVYDGGYLIFDGSANATRVNDFSDYNRTDDDE
jgi:hypothetical protein